MFITCCFCSSIQVCLCHIARTSRRRLLRAEVRMQSCMCLREVNDGLRGTGADFLGVCRLSPATLLSTIAPLLHTHVSHRCALALPKKDIIILLVLSSGFLSYPALGWSHSRGNIILLGSCCIPQCCGLIASRPV
jgi:hypothetical protein